MGNTPKSQLSDETSVIVSHLQKVKIFKDEKPKSLAKVATAFTLCIFDEGEVILRQGEQADSMYLIAEGEVSFRATDQRTGLVNKNLMTVSRGDTFGEFGMFYNVRRTTGAVATSAKVVALRLDKEIFEKIRNSKYMKKLTQRVEEVCVLMIQDGLGRLPLFQKLNADLLQQLGRVFKFEVYEAGTTVLKEGEEAEWFYYVLHGELALTRTDEDGFPVEIGLLSDGQRCGENSLLKNQTNDATVTTLSHCEIFSMHSSDFQKFFKSVPPNIKQTFEDGNFADILKRSVKTFEFLRDKNLNLLALISELHTFKKDTVLIKEGSSENKFLFVIFEGQATFLKGTKVVGFCRTGYFGELSLFTSQPSFCTVKVSSKKLKCLRIPLSGFKKILEREGPIFAEIAMRILGKDISMDVFIKHPLAKKSLLQHCKRELAEENLEFSSQVEALHELQRKKTDSKLFKAIGFDTDQLQQKKMEMMIQLCTEIFNKYINPGAETEINISDAARQPIINDFTNNNLGFDMFDQARGEVLLMLQHDIFKRYKNSDDFVQLLRDLGFYKQ